MLEYSQEVIEKFYPLESQREYVDFDRAKELYKQAEQWKEENKLNEEMHKLKKSDEKAFCTLIPFLDEKESDEYWNYWKRNLDIKSYYDCLLLCRKILEVHGADACKDILRKAL